MHLKIQTHNLVAKTHTVKAGTFPVSLYRPHPHGLYLERPFQAHPTFRHFKAHILPGLGLQICKFQTHQDDYPLEFYIDIVSVEQEGHIWRVKDLYLDLGITREGCLEVMDTDELFEGLREGLISHAEAAAASATLHDLINLLGRHGNRLSAALESRGVRLEWDLAGALERR
ncbi:MAG: DUF402 domain-containing protein [Meiothermus sp.]|nr:DUF402 domain-containing protein [Meiothermus sp.]